MFGSQILFLDQLEKQLFIEMEATVNEFDHVLKEYITERQLFERGIDGDGIQLEGYSRTTIRLKIRKGQPYDRTTLRDTEKFHASIEVTGTPYYLVISSDVEYDSWLLKKYGKGIFHFTDENFNEFLSKYYIPNLKKYVNSKFTR